MNIHLYGFKPAGLLHLVVDDRLVLIDPLISSSGEDHILDGEKEKTQIKLSNNTTVYMVILASQQVCSKWQNDDG